MNISRRSTAPLLAAVLGFVAIAYHASGQLLVGPSGLAAQTFDAAPATSEWSTLSVGPIVPGGAIGSAAQFDLVIQTNSAVAVNRALRTSSSVPPAPDGYAQWNSTGHFLQTRAQTNWYTLLMTTLRNETGTNLSSIALNYDFATVVAPGTVIIEEVPGHRAYYSLTGVTGTWVHIPELDSIGATQSAPMSAILHFDIWPSSTPLYLLWADANGSGPGGTEGGYTIDNFSVAATPAQEGPPMITSQPQSRTVSYPEPAVFSVNAVGSIPLRYQWFKDGEGILSATNANYVLSSPTAADQGTYNASVMNALGTIVSSNATLIVNCPGGTMPLSITNQPASQTLRAGQAISLDVGVAGSTPRYQWFRNGTAILGAENSAYAILEAQPSDSGFYSVRVENCAGPVMSAVAVVSVADSAYIALALTNSAWKYDQSNTDLGTAWRETDYDDSTWPLGLGLLGVETYPAIAPLIHTMLTLGSLPYIPTYYFRSWFVLTNEPYAISLVASNYFDDGAVVYVNGQQAFRYNIRDNPGFADFAFAANPAGEGIFIISNIASSLLVQGTNTIAVEVHQNSSTSGDIVFGMGLHVVPPPPTPLQIVSQPADLRVEENHPAVFAASVGNNVAALQWFGNGHAIPGATLPSFTITNPSINDSGWYVFFASNAFGVVYSRFALLSVFSDREPPRLISADWTDSTHIIAAFSEPVSAMAAANVASFSLTNTTGATLVLLQASLTNQTNVLLRTEPSSAVENYVLTAFSISDLSVHQNAVTSAIPVARQALVIGFDEVWQYFDPYPPIDPPEPGPEWKDVAYDTSAWGVGAGAFIYTAGVPANVPVPVNSYLSSTPGYVSYFRRSFPLFASPGGATLRLRYAVDDGAVFYLNGCEIHRFNMPAGIPTAQTAATPYVGDWALYSHVIEHADAVRAGENLLAIELHQMRTNDTDKFFAAEMKVRAESLLTGPVIVVRGPDDLAVMEGDSAKFTVNQAGAAAFQWQMNGTNIPGATSAMLTITNVTLTLDDSHFRCLCSNAGNSIVTPSATLRVTPDLTPPELLSAIANEDNTITLKFSKPLGAASATNTMHYVVTNELGASLRISAAALTNGTNVVLLFDSLLGGRYVVSVSHLTDVTANANVIFPGSAAIVGADYLIAMDSAWKYLAANVDESVTTGFMALGYDDSFWLGPSNALFYVETAGLPGPKNTPLSLTDEFSNRINTYYFRREFFAPATQTNVTLRLRHIIDDGFVLYLNGAEIQRFNMPAGPVASATPSSATVGDAVVVGPIDIVVTNLAAGTNVLAAEVHRNSNVSDSDVVMGIEVIAHLPSQVLDASAALRPRVALTSWGNEFALSWDRVGFILEMAENLSGPWRSVSASSPCFVPRTSSSAFFRLRR